MRCEVNRWDCVRFFIAPSPSISPVDGSVKLVCVNQSLKMGRKNCCSGGSQLVQAFLGAGVSHHTVGVAGFGQKNPSKPQKRPLLTV